MRHQKLTQIEYHKRFLLRILKKIRDDLEIALEICSRILILETSWLILLLKRLVATGINFCINMTSLIHTTLSNEMLPVKDQACEEMKEVKRKLK